MPLYDYVCKGCNHEFEALVRTGTIPECPECHSQDLERQLSTFMMTSAEHNRELVRNERKKPPQNHRADHNEKYRPARKKPFDPYARGGGAGWGWSGRWGGQNLNLT